MCIICKTCPTSQSALKEMMSIRDGFQIQGLACANSNYWRLSLLPFSIRKVEIKQGIIAKTGIIGRQAEHENDELLVESIKAVHENPEITDPHQFALEIAKLA